ncbi:MAG: hypothetical protein M1817_005393 [Caeruleum heppii]|nr:MAG: hypothetical protein M1817_005393 [Caeruleum heppii]
MAPSRISNELISGSTNPLPDASSPNLTLEHPTPEEKALTWDHNAASWRGPISLEAYHRRESSLSNQAITRGGGITHWVLVERSQSPNDRSILASCETIRKRTLVAFPRAGQIEVRECISHGIGSVFCAPAMRRRGYAGRLLTELSAKLRHWQIEPSVCGRELCPFTALWSDIGKEFYAARGWRVFPSAHVSLLPRSYNPKTSAPLPTIMRLDATSIGELCRVDELLLRQELADPHPHKMLRVAVIPDVETMQWHHAREEFVANELGKAYPEIKGAIVGDAPGQRAWCIWSRTWYDPPGPDTTSNVLHILRLVIEPGLYERSYGSVINSIAALIVAAQREAAAWELNEVQLWNPSATVLEGIQRASDISAVARESPSTEFMVIDRDSDSIPSLMWYGLDGEAGSMPDAIDAAHIDWVGNEKYAWC